jgi:hypothetical protein
VLDESDSLLLCVGSEWIHCQFHQNCCDLMIAMLGRNCS